MIAPKIPENEAERLHELYKYELLDSVYEVEFDEIVQLASKLCNAPMSLITLVDFNRQWFKAKIGIDNTETERNVSFCAHAILEDGLFEVGDATSDIRFSDNPLVTGIPNIRYYAGMPLVTGSGYKIGTLCVLDSVPRTLDEDQTFALKVLSKQVIKLFELRTLNKDLKNVTDMQQEIMTIMAHDIRGPLSSLKSTYELRNEGMFTEEEVKEIDALIPMQLDSTINLLNNIVDWGKLQLNHLAGVAAEFNLCDLVNECIGYFLLSANVKNNTLINSVDPQIRINSNRDGIEFILRNLLGNANKFTSDGTIIITTTITEEQVKISVADTGVGISAEVMESLSNKTWSRYTHGTRNEKGSGLGLRLIYEYLHNINGNIRFQSEEGSGTTVVVSFPNGEWL